MFAFDEYATLFKLARALETPRARVLHETIRRLELHLVAPTILRGALAPWGNQLAIHFRHSVREPGEFNFLLSDVDFDLVLEGDFPPADLGHLNARLARARRVFRFLGEAEIFLKPEYQTLKRAESKSDGIYGFVRMIRKLRWMEETISSGQAPYHRFKAERSNEITRKKLRAELGIEPREFDLSSIVAAWLEREFPSHQPFASEEPIWIDYLGYWLSTSPTSPDAKPILCLRRPQIATLASLVPDVFFGHPELLAAAKARREQESRLLEAWHQMVTIEELRQKAWGRTQSVLPPDYEGWIGTLEAWRRSINA